MSTNEVANRRTRVQAGEPRTNPAEDQLIQQGRTVEAENPYLDVRGDATWQEVFHGTERDEMQNGSTARERKAGTKNGKPRKRGTPAKTDSAKGKGVAENTRNTQPSQNTSKQDANESRGSQKQELEAEEEQDSTESIGEVDRTKRKTEVRVECINVTKLACNWHAVVARDVDVIFVQEHKLQGKTLKTVKERCNEEGWELMCGPSDTNTKKPNAGVGVLVRKASGVKVARGKIRTGDFKTHTTMGGPQSTMSTQIGTPMRYAMFCMDKPEATTRTRRTRRR